MNRPRSQNNPALIKKASFRTPNEYLYNVEDCATTFSLWSSPPQSEPHEIIVIAHVNGNHYIKAELRKGYHLSMTNPLRRTYKSDIASGWENPYDSRQEEFREYYYPYIANMQSVLFSFISFSSRLMIVLERETVLQELGMKVMKSDKFTVGCKMNDACQDRIAFVRELESVAGVTVAVKTVVFLKEMMDKKGKCKAILAETSKSLGECISVRDSCLVALQTKQAEFLKFKAFNDRTIDYDKLEHLFCAPTTHDMEILIQTCLTPLAVKTQSNSLKFVHELKQEMHADLKYVESLEKEIDELESDKAEFSDMYDVILHECVSKDVMCSYLMSLSNLDLLDELQCLYLHNVKECECLAQKLSNQTKFVSKEVHTELLTCFVKLEKHSVSLELNLQKRKEQAKNDTIWNEKASHGFRKEREQYIKIQDLKAKLQDNNIAISELKKLFEKGKGKSVDTKFDRPSIV
uniref:Uncharacterized protein n=1 Tax=Tanacetum cinerariifolium TaxID=118510 RepID=A0A699HSJ6_TANCI|nr:hypothetical protein [Tanacetum cinerariifolium]